METGLNNQINFFQDDSFSKDVSSEHTLCLELDSSVIRFGIFNTSNNALVVCGVKDYQSFLQSDLIDFEYGSVLGLFYSEKSFLSHNELTRNGVASVKIPELKGAYIHYSTPELALDLLSKIPKIRMYPFGANFISGGLEKNRYQSGLKLYVHISQKMICFMHFSDNKLMMYSSETLTESKEALYYTCKAIELSHFNQTESKLYLSGEIFEVYDYLKERVKNLYLNKGFKFQKSALSLARVEKQRFFSIINTYQCV
jgi:hypothetical protein